MKILLLFLLISTCSGAVFARDTLVSIAEADSLVSDSARIILRIERGERTLGRFTDTIDVTLQSTGQLIAGFDFKIATSNRYLTILNILPGEIFDSCSWDYFSARPLQRIGKAGYPSTLWQTVGMAEGISDTQPAKCFGLERPASLVRLVVSNTHVIDQVDTSTAIYFFWEDCTDNVVSSATGEKLYISTNVLDYFPVEAADSANSFPTRKGAPKQCQKPGALNPAQRRVEFHNGGVRFSLPADSPAPVILSPDSTDSAKADQIDSSKSGR